MLLWQQDLRESLSSGSHQVGLAFTPIIQLQLTRFYLFGHTIHVLCCPVGFYR